MNVKIGIISQPFTILIVYPRLSDCITDPIKVGIVFVFAFNKNAFREWISVLFPRKITFFIQFLIVSPIFTTGFRYCSFHRVDRDVKLVCGKVTFGQWPLINYNFVSPATHKNKNPNEQQEFTRKGVSQE